MGDWKDKDGKNRIAAITSISGDSIVMREKRCVCMKYVVYLTLNAK